MIETCPCGKPLTDEQVRRGRRYPASPTYCSLDCKGKYSHRPVKADHPWRSLIPRELQEARRIGQ